LIKHLIVLLMEYSWRGPLSHCKRNVLLIVIPLLALNLFQVESGNFNPTPSRRIRRGLAACLLNNLQIERFQVLPLHIIFH
jgi:hypothetical protein